MQSDDYDNVYLINKYYFFFDRLINIKFIYLQ